MSLDVTTTVARFSASAHNAIHGERNSSSALVDATMKNYAQDLIENYPVHHNGKTITSEEAYKQATDWAEKTWLPQQETELKNRLTPKSILTDLWAGMEAYGVLQTFTSFNLKEIMALKDKPEIVEGAKQFFSRVVEAFKDVRSGNSIQNAWAKHSVEGNLALWAKDSGIDAAEQKQIISALTGTGEIKIVANSGQVASDAQQQGAPNGQVANTGTVAPTADTASAIPTAPRNPLISPTAPTIANAERLKGSENKAVVSPTHVDLSNGQTPPPPLFQFVQSPILSASPAK